MRLSTRLFCAAASGLLLLAGSLTLAGPAGAIGAVTLTGSAPATAHGPGTVTFTYAIDVQTANDTTTFTTDQDAALPALDTGVTLDGAAVPASQIVQVGKDIAVQAGPDPLDGLATGAHTITFATSAGAAPASTSSTATLSWSAGTVTSSAVAVALNQIDIATALTPDTGEDTTGYLGTDEDVYLQVDVENAGYGSPDTQLVIDMGTGLALGPDAVSFDSDGSLVPCTATLGNAQQLVCDLGTLAHATSRDDPTIDVDLAPTADAPIGQTAAITATASPATGQGTDVNPANDSATAHLKFTGAAALTTTLTPKAKSVQLGASTTVKLTVHNTGPQVAGEAVAVSIVTGDNVTVTGFTGNTTVPAGMLAPAAKVVTPADTTITEEPTLWFIGDIASGHSASATLTVKATALGTARITMFAVSDAGDPNCPQFDCAPTVVSLNVVAVPLPPPAATTPTVASGLTLASTGPDSGRELGAGALLLLLGALLVRGGARRRVCGGLPVR
jgi:hypothetical protein